MVHARLLETISGSEISSQSKLWGSLVKHSGMHSFLSSAGRGESFKERGRLCVHGELLRKEPSNNEDT